ncbi:MAG: MMPL family transporter, partial [Thermoguttaceae bacterium]
MSRPLVHVARLVTWFPLATLVLGVTAAVAAIAVAQVRLKFHTNRADVLNPSAEYNRRWMEYADEFGDEEDVVVVVEGPSQEAVVPALDEIGAAVAREPRLFHAVLDKTDLTRIRSKGLHYLPLGDLLAIDGFLGPMEPVLRGDWSQLSMTRLMGSLAGVGAAGGSAAHVPPAAREMPAKFLEGFARALSGRGPYQSPWPEMTPPAALDELGSRYLLANNGRLGFVLLRFSQKDEGSFAQNTDAVDSLRKIIDLAKFQYPHVKIGLTGLPIMENDEMRVSESSMSVLTCLSLGSIFVVLLVGFGCLRHSLMATAVLLLGTIWTVGYTALVVGYLNILSIAFGSILMGLGINYGIYYVARYLQLCETSGSTREALLRTAASVGPSITISASTAACSFFMAGFTDFKGVAQLGVIAGGGILLCWLAAMTILPALIQLFDAKRFGQALPAPLDLY